MTYQPTAVLTGATGAIGSAIAAKILEKGIDLIMVVRNAEKAQTLTKKLKERYPQRNIRSEIIDLANKHEIYQLGEKISQPIDVLINNAAITPRQRQENSDHVEMQWAVNVLGYFRMIQTLRGFLRKGKEPRVVNVSSYWAGGLNLKDPEFKSRSYDNDAAYRQSKQADRMLSKTFAEKLKAERISVNACHPGDANSTLSNSLGFGGHESPEEAAETPAWLATGKAGFENTGKYFERRQATSCAFCKDEKVNEELFHLCERYG